MKRTYMHAIFLLFSSVLMCQLGAAQQSVRTVFLIRHGEKASAQGDVPLNPAGIKRAECLANTLKDAGIKQIYVTDTKRTQETAAPLAKALNLKPSIIPAKDPNTLIRDLAYSGSGNVLVVGHSDTLPFILARLKAGTIPAIGDNEYDRLFVLSVTAGTAASPVTTLRYCDCETPAAPATPRSARKPKSSKAPMTNMKKKP
jgi:broad specificity phosphatase PhoE